MSDTPAAVCPAPLEVSPSYATTSPAEGHATLMTPPELLTNKQAAKLLGVCERKLWSMTNETREISCIRIGRSVRYDPRDIEEYLQRSKQSCKAMAT